MKKTPSPFGDTIDPVSANQIGWPLLLTTMATLTLELSFARLFSVVFFYHYAFLVISMALLGLSVGAVVAKALPIKPGSFRVAMSLLCLAAALSLLPALHISLGASIWLVTNWQAFGELARVFLACMVPFVIAGAVITSSMAKGSRQVAKLYSFDLLGASLGCLLFVPAVTWLGAPNAVLLAAMIWLVASIVWLIGTRARILAGVGYLALTTLTAVLLVNLDGRLFDVRVSHGAPRTNELFAGWNSFSRVSVQKRPNDTLWIEIDGGAGTWMPSVDFEGDSGRSFAAWLGKTGPDLAFLMAKKQPKVLVIGAGGGVDVARAISAGSKDVTAVEINPLIAKTVMSEVFVKETRGLFQRPEVRLHIEDGRSFAQRSTDLFDVIQLSQVDTWAASASGAYALTENYLYTVDAVRAYTRRLAKDGKLSMSRWEFRKPRETVRLAAVMQEALLLEGVASPERHLVVILEDLPDYPDGKVRMGTVILQKDPFTPAALEALRARFAGTQMRFAYAPGLVASEPFNRLFDATQREKLFREYEYDVTPVTDDRPFFFFSGRWNQTFDKLFAFDESGDTVNTGAQFLLVGLVMMTGLAVLVLFLVPFWIVARRPQVRAREWPFLVYALAIGVGFVSLEMALIQRFVILLGNPTYSLTIVVFSLLLGSSIGSRLSARITESRLLRHSRRLLLGVAAFALVYALLLPGMVALLQTLPIAVKMLATVALVFPLALLMGTPFAIALRLVARSGSRLFEWTWALNAGATVMGAVLAILIAVLGGITVVFVTSAVLYATGALLLPRMARAQAATSESGFYVAPDTDVLVTHGDD
jgi:hypothetical protein